MVSPSPAPRHPVRVLRSSNQASAPYSAAVNCFSELRHKHTSPRRIAPASRQLGKRTKRPEVDPAAPSCFCAAQFQLSNSTVTARQTWKRCRHDGWWALLQPGGAIPGLRAKSSGRITTSRCSCVATYTTPSKRFKSSFSYAGEAFCNMLPVRLRHGVEVDGESGM